MPIGRKITPRAKMKHRTVERRARQEAEMNRIPTAKAFSPVKVREFIASGKKPFEVALRAKDQGFSLAETKRILLQAGVSRKEVSEAMFQWKMDNPRERHKTFSQRMRRDTLG